ncbi:MAG: hypothetical protein HC877_20670 [Thioploca sp.]|nr:hypothetical protein [Thioploca sp.]
MLTEYRANERGFFNLPHGWDIGILGQNSQLMGTNIVQEIETSIRDIFGAFGASFQTMGDAKFGSFALADVHDRNFGNIVIVDGMNIGKVLTIGSDGWSFASRLRDMNYPTALLPTCEPYNFPTENSIGRAQILSLAVSKNAIRPGTHVERAILEGFGIETRDDDEYFDNKKGFDIETRDADEYFDTKKENNMKEEDNNKEEEPDEHPDEKSDIFDE